MNAAVITGLVGALVGASVSIFTTWLTQPASSSAS
jgi:hypothetical protein